MVPDAAQGVDDDIVRAVAKLPHSLVKPAADVIDGQIGFQHAQADLKKLLTGRCRTIHHPGTNGRSKDFEKRAVLKSTWTLRQQFHFCQPIDEVLTPTIAPLYGTQWSTSFGIELQEIPGLFDHNLLAGKEVALVGIGINGYPASVVGNNVSL